MSVWRLGAEIKTMNDFNLDELVKDALRDPVIKAAAVENDFRRWLSEEITKECKRKNITVRAFVDAMEIPKSQVQRLLNKEAGGNLTLRSVMRALVILNRIEYFFGPHRSNLHTRREYFVLAKKKMNRLL